MTNIAPEVVDQFLHFVWFFYIALFCHRAGARGLKGMLLIASLVVLPREFVDQYGDGGVGIGKLTDIFFCYLGTVAGWFVTRR